MTTRPDEVEARAAVGSMLAAALRYAEHGVAVFPLNGKAPLTEHGFHDATTDLEQVRRWWTRWKNAGIGSPSFDVVDVDLYKPEAAATWETIKPLIEPSTPQSRTGRGGLQFMFAPGSLEEGKIGPGVDSRYSGRNYVVLPPSQHPDTGKPYVWVDSVLAYPPRPAPAFPHDANGGGSALAIARRIASGAPIESDRNTSTFWYAVGLIESNPGEPIAAIEPRVRAWVDSRCAGDLAMVNVAKQVKGAAKWVVEHGRGDAGAEAPEFDWKPLSEIVVKPVVFVLKPFLQKAAFHLLVGIKNAGKGTWLAHWAACTTRGELGPRRRVIWVALGEDSYSIDVRPRIEAAGGDPALVTVLERGRLLLPAHAGELERLAVELGDVGMIIVDPVGGTLQAGKSTNFDADVRPLLTALNELADRTESTVIGVRHLSIKAERRAGGTIGAVLGSSDWINVPRAVLALVHDDVDDAVRHLFVITGNRVRGDAPGLMFRIEGHPPPGGGEEVTKARVLGESAKDPDELLAHKQQRKLSKTDAAKQLILETLRAADKLQVESDALDADIARRTGLGAKTIRNVRSEMRAAGLIRSVPEKDEHGEVERWFVTLTGAGLVDPPRPESQIPSTHNFSGSGLSIPDPDSRVSGSGESRDLDDGPESADFVTPESAS